VVVVKVNTVIGMSLFLSTAGAPCCNVWVGGVICRQTEFQCTRTVVRL